MVSLPRNKKSIGCRWVYRIKHKTDGSIDKYKARSVAKGFTQTQRVDYYETFSPVVKLTTVRLVLALASANNWFLDQLDVDNTFLHGDLTEDIYMKPPLSDLVYKLQKYVYGLITCFKIFMYTPYSVFCDNNFIIHIIKNPSFYEKTKYTEIDCHIAG